MDGRNCVQSLKCSHLIPIRLRGGARRHRRLKRRALPIGDEAHHRPPACHRSALFPPPYSLRSTASPLALARRHTRPDCDSPRDCPSARSLATTAYSACHGSVPRCDHVSPLHPTLLLLLSDIHLTSPCFSLSLDRQGSHWGAAVRRDDGSTPCPGRDDDDDEGAGVWAVAGGGPRVGEGVLILVARSHSQGHRPRPPDRCRPRVRRATG